MSDPLRPPGTEPSPDQPHAGQGSPSDPDFRTEAVPRSAAPNGDPQSTVGDAREKVPMSRPAARTGAAPLDAPGYEIITELGRGGMGVVYLARDHRRGHVVALKTLQALQAAGLYGFKHEFRALAGVHHPNLVSLYELVSDGQTWFFTMEFVEGTDFLTHVRGPAGAPAEPDLGRLRKALRQLAGGLQALHSAGLLHRDIKPKNVLVSPAGRVVILDFGLAAEIDAAGLHANTDEVAHGTVAYMSPEQAAALPVSAATDWYSFGVILYRCLAGRLPFEGTSYQILLEKGTREPVSPAELVKGLPEDLVRLCMELLRLDPAQRPHGPEIIQRLEGVSGDTRATQHFATPTPGPLLVGRESHLNALENAAAALSYGRPVSVRLPGPSGAGKTTLLQAFMQRVREHGGVALAGRCYEQESVPYKAFDGVIDALSRHLRSLQPLEVEALLPRDVAPLVRVFPTLGQVESVAGWARPGHTPPQPQELRRRGFNALRELLARLGDRRPLVLIVDDLQWGDIDSAALLEELLRPPAAPRLLLLLAYRSEDVLRTPALRALLEAEERVGTALDRRELPVSPLGPEDARHLAAALLAADCERPRGDAERVARESRGNPFFIWELALALRRGAGEGPAAGDADLDAVLWRRIVALPDEARQILTVLAVAGQEIPLAVACQAARLCGSELPALAALRAGRLTRGAGSGPDTMLATYHDRVRETLLARLAPEELRDSHLRLAGAFEATGLGDSEALAVHFHGAGDVAKAGRYYTEAAAAAMKKLAFDHAAGLYRLALGLAPADPRERHRLRVCRADALASAGRGADSARQYLEAAAEADGLEAIELRRRSATQFLGSGQFDDGVAVLRGVLRSVGVSFPGGPLRSLTGVLLRRAWLGIRGLRFRPVAAEDVRPLDRLRIDVCWSAMIGLSNIDPLLGAYFQSRGFLLALRAGEPARVLRSLAAEAGHSSTEGGAGVGRPAKLFAAADELARDVDDPHARCTLLLAKGIAASQQGRWQEAVRWCDEADALLRARCAGVVGELNYTLQFATNALIEMGAVAELAKRLPGALTEARERDDLFAQVTLSTYVTSLVRLAADDPRSAAEAATQALARWPSGGGLVQHALAMYAQVAIELYRGDGPAAWTRVEDTWPRLRRSLLFRVQYIRIRATFERGRAALAVATQTAHPDAYRRVAAWCARQLRREGMAWPKALAELLEVGISALAGIQTSTPDALAAVAARLDRLDMHLLAAAARRRCGLLRGGSDGDALVAAADAWMAGQRIVDPGRMTATLVTGFRD